jgi:hypothetical protein
MNLGSSFSSSKIAQLWLQHVQPVLKQQMSALSVWHTVMDHVYSTGPVRMGLSPHFFKLGWGGPSLEILREFIEKNLHMINNNEANSLPWPPAIVQVRLLAWTFEVGSEVDAALQGRCKRYRCNINELVYGSVIGALLCCQWNRA